MVFFEWLTLLSWCCEKWRCRWGWSLGWYGRFSSRWRRILFLFKYNRQHLWWRMIRLNFYHNYCWWNITVFILHNDLVVTAPIISNQFVGILFNLTMIKCWWGCRNKSTFNRLSRGWGWSEFLERFDTTFVENLKYGLANESVFCRSLDHACTLISHDPRQN